MKTTIIVIALYIMSIPSISLGQQDTTWNRWSWLTGNWVGEGNGVPGQGSGWFSFLPGLDGKILVRKSHSEYPATKDKPEIIHDDLMIVYHDNPDQSAKAIYFDNEGHTINYSIVYSDTAVIFTSNKTQDAPVFRLTYVLLDKDAIDAKFEMSRDSEKFMTYTEGKCIKKK